MNREKRSPEEDIQVRRKRASDWYYANLERAREARRKYYEKNKDRLAAYSRSYREANRDRLAEYDRNRAASPERIEANATWRRNNSAKVVARVKKWRAENPERARIANASRQAERRARKRLTQVEHIDLLEFRMKSDPICGICSGPLNRFFADVDHIIPLAMGGGHVWGNLQLAHASCNRRKGASIQNRVYSI